MHSTSLWVLSSVVCSLALGCGGDDGGGTGGVSGSKQLSTLSPSEAKSLCNALQAKFTRVAAAYDKLDCTATAYGASGGDSSTCNAARTQCLNGGSQDDSAFDLDCDASDTGIKDCGNATVDDLSKCADALATSTEAAANKLSCSSTASDFQNFGSTFMTPSECTTATNACPAFDDMMDDNND